MIGLFIFSRLCLLRHRLQGKLLQYSTWNSTMYKDKIYHSCATSINIISIETVSVSTFITSVCFAWSDPEWVCYIIIQLMHSYTCHSLQKSSANPISLFMYKLRGSSSMENQPITANLSKIALYWHSQSNLNSYILANEIAWLQIIRKWHTDLSGYTRGILQARKTLVSIPLLSCSAVQWYFSRSTERKILSHTKEWKLNRFFSSDTRSLLPDPLISIIVIINI